jgi:hypothetical protein
MRPLLLLLVLAGSLRGEVPPLLNEIAERWTDLRDQWSFTQFVREYDGASVAEERVEHYDITRGEEHRWQLVTINGRPPTAEEEATWNKRKNKPRKRDIKPLSEFFDLDHAWVVSEDERSVSYAVPLQRTAGWIFPGEKVAVTVTINKQSHTVEKGRVTIDGPFNIALGLAKIVDLDFDLEIPTNADGSPMDPPQAHGTAYAVVNKLGRRVEYSWSDFVRRADEPSPSPR